MDEEQINVSVARPVIEAPAKAVGLSSEISAPQTFVVPAQTCPSCGNTAARITAQTTLDPWVYVLGDVDPKYPTLAVEKEATGAIARLGGAARGLSNDAALQMALEAPENAYLVREMCFVLLVQEVETYILVPRSPLDYPKLVEAAKYELSAVVGIIGPVADPSVCNGLILPYLIFDVIYNFNKPDLVASMPLPQGADEAKFRAAASDIFNRVTPLTNIGQGTARALAYLAVKDHGFYHQIWNAFNQNAQLTSIEVKPAPVSSPLNLVDVVVCTTDRSTAVRSCVYARVALAGKFPHVVTYWQPYLGQ